MDSTTIDEDLVEEREDLIVFPGENYSRAIIKKAHFLKPCASSIERFEGTFRPAPSPDLKVSPLRVIFRGWRLPDKKFKFWVEKMAALHKPTWLKSGIYEAIIASTYKIIKNPYLILSLAQKWCSQTNTLVFPWGEATITLEDVYVLLGFPVSGLSVSAALQSSDMEEAIEKLEKRMQESKTQGLWIHSFADDEMEHEAFLALWLTKFVFPDHSGLPIRKKIVPIAVRLARGDKIALAPAVLATLYRDLGKLGALASSTPNIYLRSSLFKLVQVWIWERSNSIRPEARLPIGKPRIARWSGLKQRFENDVQILFNDFEWRPYTNPLEYQTSPRFYVEEAKWVRINESLDGDNDEFVTFARCVRDSQLVGIGLVEAYYPNRVAMQFGLAQDLPGKVIDHSSNLTEQEAWDDYNRTLDGMKLYIPSRFVTASVTARYRDWWTKSVAEMPKESTETSSARITVDHYDSGDDDVALKVMPQRQVFEKLDDGLKKAMQFEKKSGKRASGDDESAETQDDDNLTIAQVLKLRKKCGNLKTSGGERSTLHVNNNVSGLSQKLPSGGEGSTLHVNNNVSGLSQKLPSGDETVATREAKQKSEEYNEKNSVNTSSGVAEKEDDGEGLEQRMLALKELALQIEAGLLIVEKTLAKLKEWKTRRTHTKAPVTA